jgi:hypothetical protein
LRVARLEKWLDAIKEHADRKPSSASEAPSKITTASRRHSTATRPKALNAEPSLPAVGRLLGTPTAVWSGELRKTTDDLARILPAV